MYYHDLVVFKPLETVVQWRDADRAQKAARLVQSYVISERMTDQLVNLILPNLQLQTQRDNKGVLSIGNGKSHLMATLSGLAEHLETLEFPGDEQVKTAARPIVAKFKVLRVEISEVLCTLDELQRRFSDHLRAQMRGKDAGNTRLTLDR